MEEGDDKHKLNVIAASKSAISVGGFRAKGVQFYQNYFGIFIS